MPPSSTSTVVDHPEFPGCPDCPYRSTGTAMHCFRCASGVLVKAANPCHTCSQEVHAGLQCGNRLCRDPDRSIDQIFAIAKAVDPLLEKIKRFKYAGATGWAPIFGRLLFGYVAKEASFYYDLVVANPTFVGPDGSKIHHTELVVQAAAREDTEGFFDFDENDPPLLVKTRATPKSAAAGATIDSKIAAADEMAAAIEVTDPEVIEGKSILVFDDILTTGYQLDRVARVLMQHGAGLVDGVVLGRYPWK